jgi:hypothetical protein
MDANWTPALTRRLRVLLHTSPLHDLRRRFLRGPASQRHYDALALATRAMDAVVDRMGLDEEGGREDILHALTPLMEAMDRDAGVRPSPARYEKVVERVIAGLRNDGDGRAPFEAEYTELDEAGAATRRRLEFRLLTETHHPSGRAALRLSNEGVNLTLRLLDLDIEDAQAATEAVVRSQLDRGRFEDALASARQARFQSVRFQEKVTRIARETRRDVARLDWAEAVPALLDDAMAHISRRLEAEGAILAAAGERLELLPEEDEEARLAVARVAELIRGCRVRHAELHEHLMKLRGVFLDAQAHQSFVPASRDPRPDLRGQVLEPLLELGRDEAGRVLERSCPALFGAVAPRLARLDTLVGWLLMPRRQEPKEAVPVEAVDAAVVADPPPRFAPPIRRQVAGWLAGVRAPTTLSELLAAARAGAPPEEALELLVLCALQRFAPDPAAARPADAGLPAGLPAGLIARRLEGPLQDPDFFGDEIELRPRETPGATL